MTSVITRQDDVEGVRSGLNLGPERLKEYEEKLMKELGPLIWNALNDTNIGEIFVNGNGHVLFARHGSQGYELHPKRLSPEEREGICKAVLSIHNLGQVAQKPLYNVELPFVGSRMSITGPPTAVGGWEFSLRKRTLVRRSFDDLVRQNTLTQDQADCLKWAVDEHKTLCVAGATGAGKTVLLQTCNDYLIDGIRDGCKERLIYIEHVCELFVDYPQCVRWRTDYGTEMVDLIHQALRQTPQRIICGELRDGSALPYLRGLSTGHRGALFSIHANSARHALNRLCDLIHENPTVNASMRAEPIVAEAVQVIAFIQKRPDETRYVPSIIEVAGVGAAPGEFLTKPLTKTRAA